MSAWYLIVVALLLSLDLISPRCCSSRDFCPGKTSLGTFVIHTSCLSPRLPRLWGELLQLIICNRGLQNQTLTYGNIMSRLHNLKLFNNPIRNTLSRSSHLIQGVHCPSVSSSPVAPGLVPSLLLSLMTWWTLGWTVDPGKLAWIPLNPLSPLSKLS